MINIDSGKLTIPEDERYVGVAGDNLTLYKDIVLYHHSERNCTFLLMLRFDDGTVRTVNLSPYYYSSDVRLTWEIAREDLHSGGIVSAQVKIIFPDGRVSLTDRDFFIVGYSQEGSADDDYATRAELSELNRNLHAEILGTESACKEYAKAYTDALAADVYTKSEIDDMIGDLEETLADV